LELLKLINKMESKKNGKRKISTKGYVLIYFPQHPNAKGGYVLEHRLRVETFIKRYLTKEERVHHLDFDKKNNSIRNLMLFPTNSAHMKFHTKLRQHGMTNPLLRQIKNRWDGLI